MSNLYIAWLTSPIGLEITEKVKTFSNSLTATTKLRDSYSAVDVELIRQAITQATLQTKAKVGTPAHFIFTDDGLQQATRPNVAKFRAEFITELFGKQNIVDLTCGLGFDSFYLASAGHSVTAVEFDPAVAAIAKHNLEVVKVPVHCVDATKVQIPENTDLIFIDPARRDPSAARSLLGQTKRALNPKDWSPNWDFVQSLANEYKVVAKVSPGISEEFIGNWDAYWISCDGDLVETMLISGGEGKRSAVLITGSEIQEISGGQNTLTAPIGKYLIVPNSALIRASGLNYLAQELNAGLVNEHIAWLTTDNLKAENFHTPSAQIFEITETAKLNEKDLKKRLDSYAPHSLTIMTRGVELDPDSLRKKLLKKSSKGGPELVLAIYRDDDGNKVFICKRLPKYA